MKLVKNIFSYQWLIGAFIALFFTLQSYSLSHASSFGDVPHDHDGIACDITVIAPDEDISLPVETPDYIIEAFKIPAHYNFHVPGRFETFLTRGPPPRGPPTLF